MEVFTISEDTIDKIKKKRIMIVVFTGIISVIIFGILFFFTIGNDNLKIFVIILCVSIILITLVLFFSLRYSIKLLQKNLHNVQYIIENNRIFMKQNELSQYNFSANEIKCINRFKNNEVIIELNTSKKIAVNNYLDSFDKFIDKLNIISTVNFINKNQKLDLENVNLTGLYSFFIIIILIFIGRIIINVFNINIPDFDDNDPLVLLEILPCIILGLFSYFIGWKMDKRIKNKKYIIILFFSFEIVFLIIFLSEFYLKSFKYGFLMTSVFLPLFLFQVLFIYLSIRVANEKENAN